MVYYIFYRKKRCQSSKNPHFSKIFWREFIFCEEKAMISKRLVGKSFFFAERIKIWEALLKLFKWGLNSSRFKAFFKLDMILQKLISFLLWTRVNRSTVEFRYNDILGHSTKYQYIENIFISRILIYSKNLVSLENSIIISRIIVLSRIVIS